MKKLSIQSTPANLRQPHLGGGCILPDDLSWPLLKDKRPLVHLLSIPADWISEELLGWISVFTPYYLDDDFKHWEELINNEDNQSVIIYSLVEGKEFNKSEITSSPVLITIEDCEENPARRTISSIGENLKWIQDVEVVSNHKCLIVINGDDFDESFTPDVGIFSGGAVYCFIRSNLKNGDFGPIGKITFQFS
jgi:hypothetical protein